MLQFNKKIYLNSARGSILLKMTKKSPFKLINLTFSIFEFCSITSNENFSHQTKNGGLLGRTFWFGRLFSLPWFPIHFQTHLVFTHCYEYSCIIQIYQTTMTSLYSYYNTWCNILLLLLYNLHGVRLSYRMSTSRTVFSNRRLKRQPPFCWKEHHGFAFHIAPQYNSPLLRRFFAISSSSSG